MLRKLSATMMVLGLAAAVIMSTTGCDDIQGDISFGPAETEVTYVDPYATSDWYYWEYWEVWY